jgi:hypothetical protein
MWCRRYRGFTTDREGLVPVQMTVENGDWAGTPTMSHGDQPEQKVVGDGMRKPIGYALLLSGSAAGIAASVFTGAALSAKADYDNTTFERPAAEAQDRYDRYRTAAWVSVATAAVLAGTGAVLILWPSKPAKRATAPKALGSIGLTPMGIVGQASF